ncbi:DNA topoisomerase 2 [Tanacetum coccineum]
MPFTVYPLVASLLVNANAVNRSIRFDNPVRGLNPTVRTHVTDILWLIDVDGWMGQNADIKDGVSGLGTSEIKEGAEYFADLDHPMKDFVWADDKDGDAIELAFSMKKIEARKDWLRALQVWSLLAFVNLRRAWLGVLRGREW